MIIDFSQAVEGEFYTVDEAIPLADTLTGSREGKFLKNGRLKGWYTYMDGNLAVDCTLETEAEFSCDRCGKQVIIPFTIQVSETFFKDKPDEYSLTYSDDEVDLQPVIEDRVILAMPTQVLCKKSCKGLCPKCGQDLNEGKCNCNITDVEGENAFSVLKNMNINSGGATNGSTKK